MINNLKYSKRENETSNPMWENQSKSDQLIQLKKEMEDQDNLVIDIEKGIDDLGNIAQDINTESKEHEDLINELDSNVKESNNRVKFITDMTKKVIEKSGGECRCFIIAFLAVLFLVLLLILIFA